MNQLTDFQLGALVLAIDGEGCITVSKNAKESLPHGYFFRPTVGIYNTNLHLLEVLHGWYGGRVSKTGIKKAPEKQGYALLFTREQLEAELLQTLAQNLIIKSEQAKLLMVYFQICNKEKYLTFASKDPELREAIWNIKSKIHAKFLTLKWACVCGTKPRNRGELLSCQILKGQE